MKFPGRYKDGYQGGDSRRYHPNDGELLQELLKPDAPIGSDKHDQLAEEFSILKQAAKDAGTRLTLDEFFKSKVAELEPGRKEVKGATGAATDRSQR